MQYFGIGPGFAEPCMVEYENGGGGGGGEIHELRRDSPTDSNFMIQICPTATATWVTCHLCGAFENS